MKILDYIYYRIYTIFKIKKSSVPEAQGIGLLSLFETFVFIDLLTIIKIVWDHPIPKWYNKFMILPVYFLFVLLNWKKYYNTSIKSFKDHFEINGQITTKKNDIWIMIIILAVLLFPIFYGLIKNNIIGGKDFF